MKNIYFLSDFHLDVNRSNESILREKKIIDFLTEIENDIEELFLLGDIFDFWFEFKYVIPKGYVRFLACLARISDKGIKINFFTGNHDMWLRDYFKKELNINVFFKPEKFKFNNKTFLIGHGDGLGPKQWSYKILKKLLFNNKILYKPFINIFHPDWLMPLGNLWSTYSRKNKKIDSEKFKGNSKEFLVQFCINYLKKESIDYFVFGHRHIPLVVELNKNSFYFNTGDMINQNTYVIFKDNQLSLKHLK